MKKILIVEDEPDVREFFATIFEDKGFAVQTADSGEAAIEITGFFKPDLILMDINMHVMNGIEALKRITEMDPSIQVMMVTGLDAMDKIEEAHHLGADRYIVKPFNMDKLYREVHEVLFPEEAT